MKLNRRYKQHGFSLVELMIVVVLIVIIGLGFVAVFRSKMQKADDERRAEAASVGASSALEALSSLDETQIQNGGSFRLAADRTIEITGECSPQTCDWLVLPSPNNDSIAKGYPYEQGVNPPISSNTVLLRRWLVTDVDAGLGLKEITVAVLTNLESTTPLSIKTTRVGK